MADPAASYVTLGSYLLVSCLFSSLFSGLSEMSSEADVYKSYHISRRIPVCGSANLEVVDRYGPDDRTQNFAAVDRRASLTKRTPTSQPAAPKHLRIISTAKGQNWEDQDEYHYDDTAGKGIRIYVIDSGLKEDHKVSDNPLGLPVISS